jgi:hypothetical protein
VNPGLASRLAYERRRDLIAEANPPTRLHRRPVATTVGVILIRAGRRMAGPEELRDGHLAALLSARSTMTAAEHHRHS